MKQKHETRRFSAPGTSFIRFMEINYAGKQYRLLKQEGFLFFKSIPFTIDGTRVNAPYNDPEDGVSVSINGGRLTFSTTFGLTVTWDGKSATEQSLCDAYNGFVCGLCGNGDGNKENDYVDRENNKVELVGNKYTKFFEWGSKWRTVDDSPDSNQAL